MAIVVPKPLRPVFDFATQVVVGAVAFTIVFLAAVGIAAIVKIAAHSGAPEWIVTWAEYAEAFLLAVDLFCFGLFLLSEVLKLARGLWREWSESDG